TCSPKADPGAVRVSGNFHYCCISLLDCRISLLLGRNSKGITLFPCPSGFRLRNGRPWLNRSGRRSRRSLLTSFRGKFMLFSELPSARRKPTTANRSNRRPATSRRRGPQLELLETRDLLSVFTPSHVILPAAGAATPLGITGPAGYSPAQVRHAYGFDQV